MIMNLYIGFEQNTPKVVYEKCYPLFTIQEDKLIEQ